MTAVKPKLQEYEYVYMLLQQDYTLDTRDCTTFQRACFPVEYHLYRLCNKLTGPQAGLQILVLTLLLSLDVLLNHPF